MKIMKKRIAVLSLIGIAAICILIEGCGRGCGGGGECDDLTAIAPSHCKDACFTRHGLQLDGLGWFDCNAGGTCAISNGKCVLTASDLYNKNCCYSCTSP